MLNPSEETDCAATGIVAVSTTKATGSHFVRATGLRGSTGHQDADASTVIDTEPRMALEIGQPFSAFFASSLIPPRSIPSRPSTTAWRADETTFNPASLLSPVTVDVTRMRRALPPCLPIVLASTIA